MTGCNCRECRERRKRLHARVLRLEAENERRETQRMLRKAYSSKTDHDDTCECLICHAQSGALRGTDENV